MSSPDEPDGGPCLTLTSVTAGYGSTPRLRDVSVSLSAGVHVLIGPNGSGKTTFFRVAAGVLLPTDGVVDRSRAGRVGYLTHRPAVSPRLTVEDNLQYWARMHRLPGDHRVPRALERLGLGPVREHAASTLSRGQAQRLAFARVLLADPTTVLLDEPLTGIDPAGVQLVLDLMTELAAQERCVLVSSHTLADLAGLPGDVLVLSDGRLAAHGSSPQLRADLDGPAYRLRLRAGTGAETALTELGLSWQRENGRGGPLLIQLTDASDVPDLVRQLVGRGIDIHGIAPATDDLTRIYLATERR